jgi:hypothetical protein
MMTRFQVVKLLYGYIGALVSRDSGDDIATSAEFAIHAEKH